MRPIHIEDHRPECQQWKSQYELPAVLSHVPEKSRGEQPPCLQLTVCHQQCERRWTRVQRNDCSPFQCAGRSAGIRASILMFQKLLQSSMRCLAIGGQVTGVSTIGNISRAGNLNKPLACRKPERQIVIFSSTQRYIESTN